MKQLFLFLFFSTTVFSQKTIELFDSYKLGEKREITIGLPESYEKNPSKKYPIIILLDGDYLFDPFFGALNYGAYWEDLPETIVVGISQNQNDERYDDCTYDEKSGYPSEKGIQFFEFIGAEILPYMEKKYRVAPFRIIAGHDTTAGFLNFFLYKDAPIFNGYISLSPELPIEMETRVPEYLAKLKNPIFYYQSSAESDSKDINEPIKKLDENIKLVVNPLLNYKYDNFKDASHYSLVLQSIPNVLYQFFDVFKPISTAEFTNKIVLLQSGFVDYLTNKYDVISKTLGLKIPVRINDFKAIEAAILKNKAYQELDKLSDIARKNYPKSMLADYELGLMYEKLGDYKKATKSYQNASQLEEIGDLTKTMMLDKFDDMKSQLKK
ncbi:alpha/beta hydrolase-fold protein [Flavobacterium sp.]|uniref:alpha/beta hydrolase-fold protein n=1 Tax=Flavobacterium sp. TaxID=239 RepID=UPI00286CBC8D|nr:alpha/beta hydrolase-fold protein [Flavobacterium sp.]